MGRGKGGEKEGREVRDLEGGVRVNGYEATK